jgi:hypothetical protein
MLSSFFSERPPVGDSCLGLLRFEKVMVGSLIILDQWVGDVVPFNSCTKVCRKSPHLHGLLDFLP